MPKPIIFSGIQPTGNLHLGNYLGALKSWVDLQNKETYKTYYCIVDEHAITVPQNPKELRKATLAVAAVYLACGLDPEKSTLFVQSHVSEHAELQWILNTFTPLGELERMTQFKDKSRRQGSGQAILAGLLNYPTLMAADILLYDTNFVPVGEDQVQHVELARTLAKKFNAVFGKTFVAPEAMLAKEGKRIMGLDDPAKKMSKSAGENNRIGLMESDEIIERKIKSAVTDSGGAVRFDEKNKPAVSNLLNIFSLVSGESIASLEKKYGEGGYAAFKRDLARAIVNTLSPIRKKYRELISDETELMKILASGAEKARTQARKKITAVKEKIGFLSLPSE